MPEEYGEKPPIHEVWNHLVEDVERLTKITHDIISIVKDKRNPLVLSERKKLPASLKFLQFQFIFKLL